MIGLVQWLIFLGLSAVSIVMAAAMLLTMSMYRAGLALMSSFVALAGLFILLDADLMALIQLMMNVGGMMVMILFMVMLMMDPGGEMMWDMKRTMRLPGPGAFSMSMPRKTPPSEQDDQAAASATTSFAAPSEAPSDWTCPMHPEVSEPAPGSCPKCGMSLVVRAKPDSKTAVADSSHTYTCPMHPEIRRDAPGQCPKCGMDLVATQSHKHGGQAAHAAHAATSGGEDPSGGSATYTCPMHPEVRADAPGQCPKCGMDLVPARQIEQQAPQHDSNVHAHGSATTTEESASKMQAMGMAGMSPRQHHQMMVDMAMSTAQLPWALAVGAASGLLLAFLMARTVWKLSADAPAQDATVAVGELLLSRYMIGFEGAAFLILAGMVGAVIFAKRETVFTPLQAALGTEASAADEEAYTCPMHLQVRQQGPGSCPVCGMQLVPAERLEHSAAHVQAHAEAQAAVAAPVYTCPMHPEVHADTLGQCPKCGMDLVPAAPAAPTGRDEHEGHA